MRCLFVVLSLCVAVPVFADDARSPVIETPKTDCSTSNPDGATPSKSLCRGEMVPFNGILLTEERHAKAIQVVLDYKKLQKDYAVDQDAWKKKEAAYQEGMDKLAKDNTKLNSWWQRNKAWAGLMAGIVAGAGATIGVVYGVKSATK